MAVEPKLVRVWNKGQVTLPAELRQRLGIEKGDLVAVVETPEGSLISPRDDPFIRALDQIGAALRERNVTLEELIESGREERAKIIREQYNLDTDDDPV